MVFLIPSVALERVSPLHGAWCGSKKALPRLSNDLHGNQPQKWERMRASTAPLSQGRVPALSRMRSSTADVGVVTSPSGQAGGCEASTMLLPTFWDRGGPPLRPAGARDCRERVSVECHPCWSPGRRGQASATHISLHRSRLACCRSHRLSSRHARCRIFAESGHGLRLEGHTDWQVAAWRKAQAG